MNVIVTPETESVIRKLAATRGQEAARLAGQWLEERAQAVNGADEEADALDQALARLANRAPEDIAAAQARAWRVCQPRQELPPGQTLYDVVAGQWPGDETDEEVAEALQRLS